MPNLQISCRAEEQQFFNTLRLGACMHHEEKKTRTDVRLKICSISGKQGRYPGVTLPEVVRIPKGREK